jgi:hypothetical protein
MKITKTKEVGGAEAWTMAIPKAGKKYYDAGRNKSYQMARDGIMPTIDVGRRGKRALVRAIERQLAGEK